jgi:hypothetical protein
MSLNDAVRSYIEANPEVTKPVFLKVAGDIFTILTGKSKGGKKKGGDEGEVKAKKSGKKIPSVDEDGEEKPAKKLNAYQVFMKEQMPLLQKRENDKPEGEPKLKPRELMTEISEMWKAKKESS